jgi:thiol-disulfide isomerase/thioredoxin
MEEFDEKVKNSATHPIFALMYTTWCPLCHGKPEKFKQLYEKHKYNNNITFTLIECKDRMWCLQKGAMSIPHWVVIKGPNHEHWESTNIDNPALFERLIDEATQGPAVQIENNNFGNRIVNTMHGSSYFHLVIQKDHEELLEEFKKVALKYIQYGCKFTYKYKSITKPSLRVYRSPFCVYKIKGNIKGFEWFMKRNKYAHMHRYTGNDMDDIDKSKPFALYVLDSNIQQAQFDNFMNLSHAYCKEVDFGQTLGIHTKTYEGKTKFTSKDAPFMVVTNHHHNCSLSSKKRLLDGERLGLYRHLIKNHTCSSYKEGWIKKRDPDTVMFSLLGLFGTAALIGLFIEVRRLLISLKLE